MQVQFKMLGAPVRPGDWRGRPTFGCSGSGVRTAEQFERKLGYAVAAFEVRGYRPRDEDIYLMYGQPGRMVGRFTLHDDRTLFLFVFAATANPAGSVDAESDAAR